MRRAVITLLLAAPLFAADPSKWLRRSMAAAACAVSAVDGWQSVTYLDGRHGLTEGNPWLRQRNGAFDVGRGISVKAVVCAATVISSERWPKWGFAVAAIETGVYIPVVVHNQRKVQ